VEALLGHTEWARRLAAGIVIDTATADDAVQDPGGALLHPPPRAESALVLASSSATGAPGARGIPPASA